MAMAILKTLLVLVNVLRVSIVSAAVVEPVLSEKIWQDIGKHDPNLVDKRLGMHNYFKAFCVTADLPDLVDASEIYNTIDTQSFVPANRGSLHLMQQIYLCRADNVKLILEYYSDPKIQSETGFDVNKSVEIGSSEVNALILAVEQYDQYDSARIEQSNAIVELLVSHGADVNTRIGIYQHCALG